jgi:hypothetical protein
LGGFRGRLYTPQRVSYHQYDEYLKVGVPTITEKQPLLADADDVAAQDEHSST